MPDKRDDLLDIYIIFAVGCHCCTGRKGRSESGKPGSGKRKQEMGSQERKYGDLEFVVQTMFPGAVASSPPPALPGGARRRPQSNDNSRLLCLVTMAGAKQQQVLPTTTATAVVAGTTNLWETVLRDAMRRSRLPSATLVFVGPKGCGKSSLLDTFLEGSASANRTHNPSGSGAAAAALTSAVVAATPEKKKGPEGSGGGGGGNNSSNATGGSGGGGAAGGGAGNTSGGSGDHPTAGQAFHPVLSYAYLDATDPAEQGPERDDSPPRVTVWSCSELEFEPLLETVLRPEELSNMAVVVAVDLSRPWEVMDSVEKVSL